MLRTAFLAYVRVLLCLQGMYLVLLGLVFFSYARDPGTSLGRMLAVALVAALLGVAEISTAVRLRGGRQGTAIAAIVIEALWSVAAGAGYGVSLSGAPVWQYFAGAALFLVAVAGLVLAPVRAYTGLVRAGTLSAHGRQEGSRVTLDPNWVSGGAGDDGATWPGRRGW